MVFAGFLGTGQEVGSAQAFPFGELAYQLL